MPDFAPTPNQQSWLQENDAVQVEQHEGGSIKAVTFTLAEAMVSGDGDAQVGEAPPATLPSDWKAGSVVDDDLPEAQVQLRRPMTPAATRWKTQGLVGGKALIVPYIDARLVMDRLNLVVGVANWEENFHTVDWGGGGLMCTLEVLATTHRDIGLGRDGKAMRSDSLKRAAVSFGLGSFLYAIPKVEFRKDSPLIHIQHKTGKNGKPQEVPWLTPLGKEELPRIYTRWLYEHGVKAYGNPLDHGDSVRATGDFEAGVDEGPEEDPDAPPTEEDKKRGEVAAGVLGKGKGK